ncbi:hypothetical protein ACFQGT_14635 [Natrialbaceae archaeon GCM10025810]|uniref:hypothetical protein n=1 Tax=Halovalidus salilacus TaxID=3075124 RepID=UPI00361E8B94
MTASSDSNDEPDVPIHCLECDTRARVPLSKLAETLERHNDRLHDGNEVARVDPDVADRLADLVAADMGLLEDAD